MFLNCAIKVIRKDLYKAWRRCVCGWMGGRRFCGVPMRAPWAVGRWEALLTQEGSAGVVGRCGGAQDCTGACVSCSVLTSHLHALGMWMCFKAVRAEMGWSVHTARLAAECGLVHNSLLFCMLQNAEFCKSISVGHSVESRTWTFRNTSAVGGFFFFFLVCLFACCNVEIEKKADHPHCGQSTRLVCCAALGCLVGRSAAGPD